MWYGCSQCAGTIGRRDAVARRPVGELGVVALPDRAARVAWIASRASSCAEQERREDVGRQIARADVDPGVLVDLAAEEPAAVGALLADDLGALDELRVVDEQRAALAAGEVLGLVEALRRQRAERAERPAAVAAEQAVRVVLDDREAVRCGDRAGSRPSRSRRRRSAPGRSPRVRGVISARSWRSSRLSVSGRMSTKTGPGAAQHERVGGRDERERRDDHLVARARGRAAAPPSPARACTRW